MRYQDTESLYISVLTLGELYFGVARLNNPVKERELNNWIGIVERQFSNRIVVVDEIAARHWGYLRALYPKAQTTDAQLAATALAHDFIFVTRNVKHFKFDGLGIINPWDV